MTKDSITFDKLLEKLKCQFLCCFSLNSIDWQNITKDLSWEQQKDLTDNTYAHALNKKLPIKLSYQLNFLKRLIQHLEQQSNEVHDAVYESYCHLQKQVAQDATQKYAYKHYVLPAYHTALTLRESKSFVAEGTTGLCSWQASLALADFLLHNKTMVCDKNLMELGAGTGLCGFIITQCCATRQVLLTDGSLECIELMHENIEGNFKMAQEISTNCFKVNQAQILNIATLAWNEVEAFDMLKSFKPDILLAADVVYDDTVFPDLANAINFIFQSRQNDIVMLLAATVRNEYTLNKFLQLLESLHFCIEEQIGVSLEQSNLFWDRTTPVKILKITK